MAVGAVYILINFWYFLCHTLFLQRSISCRSSHIWLNTRMFLVNMAFSDIVMCLTALPITPIYAFSGFWMFGEVACRILPACQVCYFFHCITVLRGEHNAGMQCADLCPVSDGNSNGPAQSLASQG